MGGLQLTLAFLALAATVKGQVAPNPPCWYEDFCSFAQNEDTSSEINTVDHATLEEQLVFCQDLCFNEATCKYFTVFNTGGARSKVFCYQLADCDHVEDASCVAAETCGSGPKDCTANTNCPVLDASTMADDETIRWHCDNINPYTEEIPEGTTCSLDCQAWEDEDGKSSSIQSICQGAELQKWTDSEAVGAGGEDVIYPTLAAVAADRPRPDSLAVDQRKCGCPPFPMAWALEDGTSVDYDPNTLPGTDFVCSDDYIVANDDGDLVFELRETNKCRLFCDGYHIATMECNGKGKWTGEPELGAWCYYEPTADDQLGVTATTTTTTVALEG